jgi:hypothetical protein
MTTSSKKARSEAARILGAKGNESQWGGKTLEERRAKTAAARAARARKRQESA